MSENLPVAMPKRSHHAPLSQVTRLQDAFDHPDFMNRIKQATPKHLTADRMLAVFVQSVQKTPKLKEVSLMSLLGAFLSVASVGLEPNTALQHAYLIPFEKRKKEGGKWITDKVEVQVIFGYQGLLDLAYRSGLLMSVHADLAWDDEIDFWFGTGGQLKHKPRGGPRPEGAIHDYAYMHAAIKGGGESFEVMPMSDVLAIRDNSQGFIAAKRARDYAARDNKPPPPAWTEAPWVKSFKPMARKTVFRAGQKWLPKSIELAAAINLDEMGERSGANFAGVIEGKADIFSGLDALPDEATDQMNVGIGGAFTGYSQQEDRQPVATTAQPSAQAAAAPSQAHQDQVGSHPAQAAHKPVFDHYLIDDTGDVGDGSFTNPGMFAERLLKLLDGTDDKAVVIENNREAILACKPFPEAAEMLVSELDFIEGGGSTAPQPEPQPQARVDADKPDPLTASIPFDTKTAAGMDAWMRKASAAMLKLNTHQMPDWLGSNVPVWRNWPPVKRMEMDRMARTRCEALGLAWYGSQPATPTASQEQQDGPTQDAGDPGPSLDD